MNGSYDASAPPPQDVPTTADVLGQLRRAGATTRLEVAMARIEELAAQFAEDETGATEDGLDPDVVARLVELTSEEGAPLEWRSLGRRVTDGHTTWAAFWARPQAETGGLALLAAVLRDQAARTRSALDAIEEEPPADARRD